MTTLKRVMIAHPMSGDIEGNTAKVVAICRAIHSEEAMPVFPSFTTRRYLTDDPHDRELAAIHIREYLKSGFVHELWLYGGRITPGMWREIRTAREFGIPVVAKTPATAAELHLHDDATKS